MKRLYTWINERLWRKKYKRTLFFVGLIGTALIAGSDYIFWKVIGWDVANVTLGEKIQAITLYLTGVVIFWYTRETYDLKQSQNKQIKEIRRQTELQQRPFLRIEWNRYPLKELITSNGDRYEEERHYYQIIAVNIGTGIAVNVEFEVSVMTQELYDTNPNTFRTVTAISPNGGTTRIFDAYHNEALQNILDPKRESNSYSIKVRYENLERTSYVQEFITSPDYNDGFAVIDW